MKQSNNLQQLKDEVILKIEQRVNFIINDNRTFIYSKIKKASDNYQYIHEFGGGNFLSTLGIFSALNLLAKINAILNDCKIYEKEELDKTKKEFEEYKKNHQKDLPLLEKLIVKGFEKTPKKPEKDCFIELYKETKDLVNWGLNSKYEAGEFWDKYRNSLSHIAIPKSGVAAHSPDQLRGVDFDTFIVCLKQNNSDIYKKNPHQAISVELFNEKLLDIYYFITKKIKFCKDGDILKRIKVVLES